MKSSITHKTMSVNTPSVTGFTTQGDDQHEVLPAPSATIGHLPAELRPI